MLGITHYQYSSSLSKTDNQWSSALMIAAFLVIWRMFGGRASHLTALRYRSDLLDAALVARGTKWIGAVELLVLARGYFCTRPCSLATCANLHSIINLQVDRRILFDSEWIYVVLVRTSTLRQTLSALFWITCRSDSRTLHVPS